MSYKIYVFEDNVELVELLAEIFRLKGDELFTYKAGDSITADLKRVTPDVILVDLRMHPTGQEIIKEIKSDPELESIPVLLFTATNIKPAEVTAMGAQGIIHKPFSLEEIERSIDKAIRKRPNALSFGNKQL